VESKAIVGETLPVLRKLFRRKREAEDNVIYVSPMFMNDGSIRLLKDNDPAWFDCSLPNTEYNFTHPDMPEPPEPFFTRLRIRLLGY
jgi:hypothetical protein